MLASEALETSVKDFSEFSSAARLTAQLTLAANGGASLGMLSFLTDMATAGPPNKTLVVFLAISAGCFLFGVLLALTAVLLFSIAKWNWGAFWEQLATEASEEKREVKVDFGRDYAVKGERLNNWAFWVLLVSIMLFVPGSMVAVLGFLSIFG